MGLYGQLFGSKAEKKFNNSDLGKGINTAGRALQTGGLSLISPEINSLYEGGKKPGYGALPGVDTSGKPLYPTLRSTLDEKGGLKKEFSAAGSWLPMAQKQIQAGTASAINQAQASGNQALQQGMGALAARGGLGAGASERMAMRSGINTSENIMQAQDKANQAGLNLATQAGQTDLQSLLAGTNQSNQMAMDKFGYETGQYQNNVQSQVLARQAEEQRRAAERAKAKGGLGTVLGIAGGAAGAFLGGPAGAGAGYQMGNSLGQFLG